MNQRDLKYLAVGLLIVLLFANLIVFALKLISALLFWLIIIVVFFIVKGWFGKKR